MKTSIYPRLAINSIRKNKRLYAPYILTCIGMIMMFYIMSFLAKGNAVEQMFAANIIYLVLNMGCVVLGVFSLIFLFYTNSFLIKRRKKEFGLYNILGMGKPNLAMVLICESLFIALISLAGGLFFGILFSKFAELIMINILKLEADLSFTIEWNAVLQTVILFAVIFLLLLINTLKQIHLSEPIELLKSENTGEKPPKSNALLAVAGIAILALAYTIAVTIKDPMDALFTFFLAVILVIIATYMLFIAGSVTLCKVLQKKKSYYYKTNHFVSVSSMVYRMKRNGAGLASICILCTMVLVMLSSTICLYTGIEDSLDSNLTRDILVETSTHEKEDFNGEKIAALENAALKSASDSNQTPQNILNYKCASILSELNGSNIKQYVNSSTQYTHSVICYIVPLADYNTVTNQNEVLADDEALVYNTHNQKYTYPDITINDELTYKIKGTASELIGNNIDMANAVPAFFIIVNDFEKATAPLESLANFNGDRALTYHQYYGYNLDCDDKIQISLYENLSDSIDHMLTEDDTLYASCTGTANKRSGLYDMFGSLFFLGILLAIVFVFAAVLIIYYKQISEGYEDQSRFEIMQKVGMDKKEIRKSINSQVLTVFFIPLVMAGIHLTFAFPMIYKMLILFSMTNLQLLILVTLACFALFALFYVLVYKMTSKAYYSIVIKVK